LRRDYQQQFDKKMKDIQILREKFGKLSIQFSVPLDVYFQAILLFKFSAFNDEDNERLQFLLLLTMDSIFKTESEFNVLVYLGSLKSTNENMSSPLNSKSSLLFSLLTMTLQRCVLALTSRDLIEPTLLSCCDILSFLINSLQADKQSAAICAYLLIHMSSQISNILRSTISTKINFDFYRIQERDISPSEKKSRGSDNGSRTLEKFVKTLIEVLIQILSLNPSEDYLLNSNYLVKQLEVWWLSTFIPYHSLYD